MPIRRAIKSTSRAVRNGAERLRKIRRKPPASPFGGFKKRTISVPEFVAGVWSLGPELGTFYRVWVKEEIDPGFREELMLAVSKLNGCRFCSWGHHEWASIAGVSDEELAKLEQLEPSGFNRRKWVAISYVRALVGRNFQRVQPELRRAMQHKYSPEEIRAIELIARVMDVGNRSSNTFDAMLSRLKGTPSAESRLVDELVLSGVFLAVAPVVLLKLSRASGRPVLEMARSLIDYTKSYEEKTGRGGHAK